MAMATREELVELLRNGLSHLYDGERLRQSPLVGLLGLAQQSDPATALRRALTAEVEALRPREDAPSQSRDWRLYEALFYYYVQQLDQRIVADQLALSVRHLRREQRAALEVMADRVHERIGDGPRQSADVDERGGADGAGAAFATENLEWLKDLPSERPTDLEETLADVMALLQSMIGQAGVGVDITVEEPLPKLAVHPVALNQILLSVLGAAVSGASAGVVRVSARPREWQVEVEVRSDIVLGTGEFSNEDAASLTIARQLVGLCGGWLELVTTSESGFSARLRLPALEQLVVLAIDDNADTLQLLERYMVGTRYRLVGTRDPRDALDMAQKVKPHAIVLDVMMPEVDGWRVMSQLREHPATGHTPVVVCTILAQKKLALALGASGFVAKPVTRQALLDVLDEQIGPRSPETVSR